MTEPNDTKSATALEREKLADALESAALIIRHADVDGVHASTVAGLIDAAEETRLVRVTERLVETVQREIGVNQ